MTSRRADLRLLLPELPASARVVSDLPGWAEGLSAGGVPDGVGLVVASAADLDGALALSPAALVVEGAAPAARLRRLGWQVRRVLPLPSAGEVEHVLPLDQPGVARTALATLTAPASGLRALRNAGVSAALGRGLPSPPGTVLVASRQAGPPVLVTAAGLDPRSGLLLLPGQGDSLSRLAALAFAPGATGPAYAVKLARTAGRAEPFARDAAGLELAHGAGPRVAGHAPELVRRFDLGGHPGSVETAGPGERLGRRLVRGSSRERLGALERVAAWCLDLAADTARPEDEVSRRLAPLAAQRGVVVPPGVPSVLAHEDLGSWNVVVTGDGFTVLDWESARPDGVPLWDLLYLLCDGLPLLAGATTHAQRAEHAVQTAAGRTPQSPVLWRWLDRAVAGLGLAPAAVGPLALLCWEHHAGSRDRRGGGEAELPAAERIAARWRVDPGLGTGWDAYARRAQ